MDFNEALENVVGKFMDFNGIVKIVGHLDTDGLTAVAILIQALKRRNISFSVSILKQIEKKVLSEIALESFDCIIFSDLGSSYLKEINDIFSDKLVIILDHHLFDNINHKLIHINPLLYNHDPNEIAGAGVAYLFSRKLDENNKDLAYLAVIGAIGDCLENKGFLGLNNEILKDAINSGKISVKKGLKMFGSQTKPLHKILQYSTDFYIPLVTGSEEGSLKLLNEVGIKPFENGKWKKLIDLSEEEIKKLVTAIILRRLGSEDKPEDIFGTIYLLNEEPEESPTKDANEFSTLLNSCGRLNKPSLGIGTCLGNKEMREKAVRLMEEYRLELIKAINWFYKNRKTNYVIEGKNYAIINAEENIKDTLIGTLASIISRSNIYEKGTKILTLAHTVDGFSKISFRIVDVDEEIDLRDELKNIMRDVGDYEYGGHKYACGGLIPQEKEELFIKLAIENLKK